MGGQVYLKYQCSGADLVPREVAEAWLKYLREELPTVGFKCSTQKQASNLGQSRVPRGGRGRGRASRQKGRPSLAMQGSDSLGAEALLQLLKNYTRNMDVKTSITVGQLFPFSFLGNHNCQCLHCCSKKGLMGIHLSCITSILWFPASTFSITSI